MDALQAYLPSFILDKAQWIVAAVAIVFSVVVTRLARLYQLSQREAAVNFSIDRPQELSSEWQGKQWDTVVDGKEILVAQVKGEWNEKKIMSYCPADGRILGEGTGGIDTETPEGIDRKVQTAKQAQTEWAKTTFAERRQVLRTLLKYILYHQDDIVTACCLDSGKTKVDASFGEILVTAEKLKWTIDHGEKALTPESRPTNMLMIYKRNVVRYEPMGVVAACVSWNYPFHNFISPVISAIFAGNAIVVKPSEHTAWSTTYFLNLVRGALSSCGHSPDIVQTAVCLPKVADVLTSHRDISQITFIGSRPVAHHVCKSAAKTLIPVTVELGGKDPSVILDDVKTFSDLDSIASILMRGVFQSAGQNCIGIERVIALPGVYKTLVNILAPRIKALRLGSITLDSKEFPDDPDVGAMISPLGFLRLEALIEEAVAEGATLICGGKRYNHPKYPNGHYFTPTLLVDVTPSMKIAQTELFAPIMLVMPAPSVEEAISIANSTEFGLGASVFSHDPVATEACVSGIKAGMVSVNDFATFYAVQLPFGGVRGSGYGRFAGEEGLRGVSNLKSVCTDRWPSVAQTRIPPTLDYPIQKTLGENRKPSGAWEMCKGVVEIGYQLTMEGQARGLKKILDNI